jgi:hypothetical protein
MTEGDQAFNLDHPVLRQEYAIYTASMDEMIRTIGDWIDQKATGGYIYGPSRFGKSRTVRWYLQNVLEERFNNKLPLVVWSRPPSNLSEREFWSLLLKASDFHFHTDKLRKLQARHLFLQQLVTLARATKQNYIVLMIDEAHDVTLNEWKWLLGLQNELDNEGYRLTVFSVASHQIGHRPDYFARTGNAHVAARFFGVGARFHGVRSIEELEFILNAYDYDSAWPPGANITTLQYFAPDAFERAERLASHAERFWNAFKSLLPHELASGVKAWPMELPMQHIAFTVEALLRQLGKGEDWECVLAEENLQAKISSTGFTNYLRFITAPE